jgi:intraflagellar transport protein 57
LAHLFTSGWAHQVNFCVPKHVAPFARSAFALPAKNPSVQFQNFLALVEWLVEESTGDRRAFSVDKFDDPNTAVNKMMLALRNLSFALDFPVAKLKVGYGEATCNVLDFLCDKALASKGFVWSAPMHEAPAEVEEAEVDEDADMGMGDIEDEAEAADEAEEAVFDGGGAGSGGKNGDESFSGQAEAHKIIENTIDPLVWKTELERVGPRLKATSGALGKEWRAHIEQTKEHEKTIQAVLPSAQQHMKSIAEQIKEAVEKMRGKEQSINNQLEHIRAEYEELTGQLKTTRDKQQTTQASVAALTSSMASIQEQLDEMKEDMAGRENSATDTSPLVNIKEALVSIKGDVQQFDLRIGVVSHTLMRAKLKLAQKRSGGKGKHKGSRHGGDKGGAEKDEDDDDDDDAGAY